MPLLYKEEHLTCFNYEKTTVPSLQVVEKTEWSTWGIDVTDTTIIFVMKGEISVSYEGNMNQPVGEGRVVLFPPGAQVRVIVDNYAKCIVCNLKEPVRLCDCMSLEKLFSETHSDRTGASTTLEINEELQHFLTNFVEYVEKGLKCIYYLELKIREMFFIFRAFYPKDELAAFFSPLLSADSRFTYFVYQNYRSTNNLQELIGKSNYGDSAFKKNFTRLFGVPASEWLREKKATHVYHDLNTTDLAIKEICDKYNFSSVPSLNAFCVRHFGKPPGQIRVESRQ